MAEHMVFVRVAGQVEYDIVYVSETVKEPDGSEHPLTIEQLHALIKDALGRHDPIAKITLDEIAIRNTNGIRFMFKKADPKLEVTFESVGGQQFQSDGGYATSQPMVPQSFQAPVVPVHTAVARPTGGETKWLNELDKNPMSFGHSGTSINEHLFVFGGFADELTVNHSLLLSDTHTPNAKFSKLRVRGEIPPPRERHSACLIGKKIYIFGGYNRGPELYYNSLYCFESETLTWSKIEPRGTPPERRCGHSASVVDGRMYIFGGRVKVKKSDSILSGTTVQYRNDVHCYDLSTNEWLRYEPRGIAPAGRALHTATVVGRKIYVFGGANSTGYRNDTSGFCDLYELDVDTMTWTECETRSIPPPPCYGHTATLVGDSMIVYFGGKGYKDLNALHSLDIKTMEWKQYAYAGNPLAPRWGHSATLHHGTRILIYGGRAAHGYYDTIDVIDVATQLIELKPEEAAKEKVRRKQEEKAKQREAINNLQNSVQELQAVLSQLGEELLSQKKLVAGLLNNITTAKAENQALKKKIDDLSGDTLPEGNGATTATATAPTSVTDGQ